MCNNFLQQMEIDALEQLISEYVKVQGQISCVMVLELASWSSESSQELLSESSEEEMRSTSTTLLLGSSLEESTLTSTCVDRLFLRVEEKNHASPWWASLESTNLALARVYGFLPPGRRRTDLFHGVPRKTHGGGALGRLLFVTAEPQSLDGGGGQHRGRRTGTWPRGLLLAEPSPRVAGHTCDGDKAATETRKAEAGEGDRRRKAGWSVY
jgi:hypothetical protein